MLCKKDATGEGYCDGSEIDCAGDVRLDATSFVLARLISTLLEIDPNSRSFVYIHIIDNVSASCNLLEKKSLSNCTEFSPRKSMRCP